MQTTTINIKGMTCTGCVNSVKSVIKRIPGVSGIEVSLDQAQAIIQHDATKSNTDQFKQAVRDAGFEVAG